MPHPERTKMFAEAGEAADRVRHLLAKSEEPLVAIGERLRRHPPRTVLTCARGSSDAASGGATGASQDPAARSLCSRSALPCCRNAVMSLRSEPSLSLARLPEVTLNVASAEPKDGALAILLHGFPEFWFGWRHQIVVLCLRYLLENMSEAQILGIDAESEVANCSVTEYAFEPQQCITGAPRLVRYNFTTPVAQGGAPVTAEPDANVAAR